MSEPQISIAGRPIGADSPVYIVAELSANHRQDLDVAVELIREAKAAGADAVKVQTYTPDTLTIASENEHFRIASGTAWDGRMLHDLYAEAYTPWEWLPELQAVAAELEIALFSTAFDRSSVDFLEEHGVPAHKIASFEIVDVQLVEAAARTGKPLIISTGMATLAEIEEAVSVARGAGATQIALLKCTSAYPAPVAEMNLRTIPHMAEAFDVPVGLSDHTLDTAVPVAAVCLGASIVEKHLTLSRAVPGPDSGFSLEPHEFTDMVKAVHTAERSLGTVRYGTSPEEEKSLVFRRSLFVVEDMKAGERFTARNIRSIRPGHGMHTRHLPRVLGGYAARDIRRGTPLAWDMVTGRT